MAIKKLSVFGQFMFAFEQDCNRKPLLKKYTASPCKLLLLSQCMNRIGKCGLPRLRQNDKQANQK
jgi:hypothetical protein